MVEQVVGVGDRIRVIDGDKIRRGTVVNILSKEETAECMMFGQLVAAVMDDTGLCEEFTYGWTAGDCYGK